MTKNWREKCISYPNLMFGRALRSARNRAVKRKIPFDLTREYLIDLFESQNGLCHYSEIPLNIVKDKEDRIHDPLKMSLDCVDPSKGYVPGNVVWCAYCINALKLKMSTNKMVDICRHVVKVASKRGW